MIAAWMLYACAAAALLAAAAAGAERALRLAGRPTRLAWAAGIAASVLVPAGAWVLARRAGPAAADAPASAGASGAGGGLALEELLARATVVVEPSSALLSLDRPLAALWILLSAGVAAWAAAGALRLRRARREWRPATVRGAEVLVAGRTGPAVAGVVRPRVVLPEWALDADPPTLELMLAHEREHVRAGDPALLAAAGAAVVLAPWNPALWWQLGRLRHAVEVDCDRRVLVRHPDPRRYGALLVAVGQRLARAGDARLPVAALASSRSSLERRIRTMTMPRPRHPMLQASALAAGAALLALAACETPRPTEVAPAGEIPLASIRSGGDYAAAGSVTLDRVREVLAATMPADARESRTGAAHEIWVVADASGAVLRTEFMKTARRSPAPAGTVPEAGESRPRTPSPDGEGMQAGPMSAGIAPDAIGSIEVMKLAPGRVTADSANVVWIALKPGARLAEGNASGAPGAKVTVRGVSSAPSSGVTTLRTSGDTAGPQPLVVVDGVITDRAALDRIDPSTIDSIEVLKGEAATRLYGDRAAGGVIRVTTKG